MDHRKCLDNLQSILITKTTHINYCIVVLILTIIFSIVKIKLLKIKALTYCRTYASHKYINDLISYDDLNIVCTMNLFCYFL